jgi:hypothetical protein
MKAAQGAYVLSLEVWGEVTVGRLGRWPLAGTYAYVGSAGGPEASSGWSATGGWRRAETRCAAGTSITCSPSGDGGALS